MGLNLKLGQRKKKIPVLGAWFLKFFLNVQSFGAGQHRKGSWIIEWVKYVILEGVRKQKDVKPPNPYHILALWFLEWSLVELQVESENLTQILGWVMDSVRSGCTRLYLSVTSADLQRHYLLTEDALKCTGGRLTSSCPLGSGEHSVLRRYLQSSDLAGFCEMPRALLHASVLHDTDVPWGSWSSPEQ